MTSFKKIHSEAKFFFEHARGSHDFDHVERVVKLALHIGQKEKADLEIIKIAALLHDIKRQNTDEEILKAVGISDNKPDHALQGAKLAETILKKHKFSDKKIAKIVHCIEAHRFRNKVKPETLEAKILFDADKLDSIGAIGVGRAFLFAGELGAKLHNSKKSDAEILKTKEYGQEDTAYREYLVKLRHIKDHMQTREGRRLAKKRHEFMLRFFKELKKEIK